MDTQVAKIKKSHKKAGKGTLRWVRLDEYDQDDRNELPLFLLGTSDSERKQLSTNAFCLAIYLPPRKFLSFSGFLNYMESDSKNSVRKWKAVDHHRGSNDLLLPIQTNQSRSSNVRFSPFCLQIS
ncbi:hypothetical protein Bca52824_066601 [Brassica carinata]|uniref:Uncharacterized protein n=1 Tax=Brassica carinata TaxID=52824 RepID=A0A8X7UDJ1_BRACI|nr:hypothetical protein Bca52824_066601 [Brassica carinata]